MDGDIILIGPIAAGKTSVSNDLAKELKKPKRHLDLNIRDYYKPGNYDPLYAQELRKTDINAFYVYRERFNLFVVEQELLHYKGSIFDFGAYHSVYRIDENVRRIETILKPYPYVFLLLPSNDIEESKRILWKRRQDNPTITEEESLKDSDYLLKNPSNSLLAKHTIYTTGKSPSVISKSMIQKIRNL